MDAALSPILVLALMTPALQVIAQEQPELQQRVRRDDPVYVTDDAGTVKEKVTDISDATLRALVGDTPSPWVDLSVPDVHLERPASRDLFRVAGERPGPRATLSPNVAPSRDSILMGGLIGLGAGAVLGATVGAEACLHEPRWHCAVKVGVPVAAIGAVIGWLHK